MLRTIRRHQIITDFGKFIIWFIIIIATIFSYQAFLKPFADKLQIFGLSGIQPGTFGVATTTPIGKLINSFTPGN